MARSTIKKIEDSVKFPSTSKYLCKRGKGAHLFLIKKLKRYPQCAGFFNGLKCLSGLEKDGQCPKGLERIDDMIFEEWRCRYCNKKDIKIRHENPEMQKLS